MREPYLSNMLGKTVRGLETDIPQMISFMASEIDQQPWERFAKATYISDSETEIGLMALLRDMLGNASVPGLYGAALLGKYPDLLHDVYDMDAGLKFFLMGLPFYTPWPRVLKAHMARSRLWNALGLFSPSSFRAKFVENRDKNPSTHLSYSPRGFPVSYTTIHFIANAVE